MGDAVYLYRIFGAVNKGVLQSGAVNNVERR